MPRLAVSLSEEQYDWIDSQSESRDIPMAQVVRDAIDRQRGIDSANDSEDESLREKVNQLETRLEHVESQIESPPESPPEPAFEPEPEPADDQDDLREEMEAALDELHVPGRKAAVERSRREAIVYAWERLREYESVNAQRLANDTFGAFFDNDYLGYSTSSEYPGYGLWDNCVRDVLQELPGVEPPGARGKTYRWNPEANRRN